jgi:hypothetical protein
MAVFRPTPPLLGMATAAGKGAGRPVRAAKPDHLGDLLGDLEQAKAERIVRKARRSMSELVSPMSAMG